MDGIATNQDRPMKLVDQRTFFKGSCAKYLGKAVEPCQPSTEDLISMHSKNQLLARMLVHTDDESPSLFEQLSREIDEMEYNKVLMGVSTSLPFKKIPCELWGDIGFLLDVKKLNVRFVSKSVCSTCRLSNSGNSVIWSPQKKQYIDEFKKTPVEFNGYFNADTTENMDNIENLKGVSQKDYNSIKRPLNLNELVVDYDESSVAGIVGAVDRPYMKIWPNNEKTKKFLLKARAICSEYPLKKNLPLFIYNCSTGDFSSFDST